MIFHRMEKNAFVIFVREIVTHSPLGENEFRLRRVALDLLPQAADVHVHGAQIAQIVVLPDGFQQVLAGKHLAAFGREQLQKVKLLRSQVDLAPIDGHRAVGQVDRHVAHVHDLAAAVPLRAARPAEDGLDARLDLQHVEGLGHVVVRAVLKAEDLVHILALGRQHDDRHVALFADALAHLNAVQLGQHHVQQDQVERFVEELVQRFLAVRRRIGLIANLLQAVFKSLDDQRLVVHQQNSLGHCGSSSAKTDRFPLICQYTSYYTPQL